MFETAVMSLKPGKKPSALHNLTDINMKRSTVACMLTTNNDNAKAEVPVNELLIGFIDERSDIHHNDVLSPARHWVTTMKT